ncbi:MAG: M16 family metallopeptidase [Gemmatimonadales bacterium]
MTNRRVLLGAAAVLAAAPLSLPAQVDRTRPPAAGSLRPYRFPQVERVQLGNGLQVLVVERPALPIVTLSLVLPAGAELDPAGQGGLAQLAARLLTEGTKTQTAAQIAESLEGLGGTISSSAGWDAAFVQVTVLARNADPAMRIMADVTVNASFPEREVERLKNQRLAEIQQQRARPEGLANEMFYRLAYDSGSAYAWPSGGTPETVRGLTREHFAAFHGATYRPNAATLIAVGAVRAADVRRLAGQHFGAWTRGELRARQPVARPGRAGGRIYLFDRPAAVQSALAVGGLAIARNDPDYIGAQVLNTVLGGAFGSRINMNLREARGYTYGAFSGFFTPRMTGSFAAQSAVRTPTTDSSVTELLKEMRRIRDEAVPADELEGARQNLIGRFPADLLTNQALATALSNRVVYGLPADYYDTYRDRIAAVDAGTVQALARKYVNPASFVWVIVGDASVVEEPLRKLGGMPVEVYDLEGKKLR